MIPKTTVTAWRPHLQRPGVDRLWYQKLKSRQAAGPFCDNNSELKNLLEHRKGGTMNIESIAATAISTALVYLGKGGEEIAKGIGKDLWELVKSQFYPT